LRIPKFLAGIATVAVLVSACSSGASPTPAPTTAPTEAPTAAPTAAPTEAESTTAQGLACKRQNMCGPAGSTVRTIVAEPGMNTSE